MQCKKENTSKRACVRRSPQSKRDTQGTKKESENYKYFAEEETIVLTQYDTEMQSFSQSCSTFTVPQCEKSANMRVECETYSGSVLPNCKCAAPPLAKLKVGTTASICGVVLQKNPARTITTKKGRQVRLSSILLADPTRSFFQLTLWGKICSSPIVSRFRVGDVLFGEHVLVKMFQGKIQASTTFSTKLSRIFSRTEYQRQQILEYNHNPTTSNPPVEYIEKHFLFSWLEESFPTLLQQADLKARQQKMLQANPNPKQTNGIVDGSLMQMQGKNTNYVTMSLFPGEMLFENQSCTTTSVQQSEIFQNDCNDEFCNDFFDVNVTVVGAYWPSLYDKDLSLDTIHHIVRVVKRYEHDMIDVRENHSDPLVQFEYCPFILMLSSLKKSLHLNIDTNNTNSFIKVNVKPKVAKKLFANIPPRTISKHIHKQQYNDNQRSNKIPNIEERNHNNPNPNGDDAIESNKYIQAALGNNPASIVLHTASTIVSGHDKFIARIKKVRQYDANGIIKVEGNEYELVSLKFLL